MAWSAPGTAVTHTTITAAFWNGTYQGDFNLTLGGLAAASGDTIYATGANATAKLSVGSKLDVYRVNSGATAPEWGTYPPSALVSNAGSTANTTAATSTDTAIRFDTTDFNYDSMAALGTHNERLTCNTPGLYIVTGCYYVNDAINTEVNIRIAKYNSSNVFQDYYGEHTNWNQSQACYFNCYALVSMVAGDYIRLMFWQNSGGNVTGSGGTRATCSLSAALVSS